jgi:hypothetical protein
MAAETSSQASRIGPPSPTQNFASGKLDSIPSAADGLSAFFRLKPVPYVAGENASKSKSTRPPKFFDLHLYEPLQLKTVVVSEELTQRFSSICDQKIRALDAKIVHRPASAPAVFPELTDMKASSEEIVQDINSEASIVEDYSRRTGEACLKVASKLLFGLENNGNLRWEKTDRTAEQALPDVYLTLGDKEISLCQEQIKSFDSIRKHLLHRLTLVEFKSLVAGDLEVMTEIVNLAGKFTWMTCGSTDHGRMHNCGVKKHATGNVSSVTGRKTGYDATQAWWTKTSPVLLRKRRNDPFPELDPEQVEETSTKASVYTTTVASCESPGNIMAHEGVELDSMLPIKQEQPLVPPQAHGDFASCSKPESDPNSNGNQDEDEPHSACDILQQVSDCS